MNDAIVNLDVAAMRTVFQCFDVNKSGGIDLQELQSAVKVLGISINPREVAKMFHAADTDGSGEVDFDEFTAIMHKSDGGAFARMIRKVHEDEACRDIMRSRMRPIPLAPGPLEEQLAALREEREWYSTLHMNTIKAQLLSAKAGYHGETTMYVKPSSPMASPTRITDDLHLSTGQAATRSYRPVLLPVADDASGGAPSPPRGLGLRRLVAPKSDAPTATARGSLPPLSPPLPPRKRLHGSPSTTALPDLASIGSRRSVSLPLQRSRSQLSLHDTQWSRSQLTFHDTHAHPAVGVLYYAN